ncbi:MAG: prohibitin family protein [candidate division NC10 bacterium]|nr:prohibitin family protein [candidate division NC10 bacterium]
MRLIFGIILVMTGVFGSMVLSRLLVSARGGREAGVEGGLKALRIVAMVVVPIGALMIISSGVRMIGAGQVGVALLFGKVQQVALHEGINLVNPLYDVVEMNTRVQKHQARYDAASKDLQAVHVEMVLNYRLKPDQATEVYQRIGPNYASVIIDPAAQEVLKANTALHIATEILHQRPKIKADVQRELTTWLAKYGIEMKEASLANIRFDPTYEKAIEAKQIEEQKAEQKRYELIQAQRQAEIVAAQAKGQGDAAREKAKGDAEAIRIRGSAEAEYNQKVAASLTQTLIQQRYLEKCDGKLPQFSMGSGGSTPGMLFNLPVPPAGRP